MRSTADPSSPAGLRPAHRVMTVAEKFGRYIRQEREWAGLTQMQLGSEARMQQAHLSELERGKVCPRLDTVVKLLAILGADPREALEALD